MTKKIEIIMGYVEQPVAVGAAGNSIVDQYNTDKTGYALVNQSTQTGAAIAGVTSLVKLTAGFTPFLNIKMNTLAATTVFLKITAEYRSDQTFNEGDILSLVGNVAGVAGGVTLLAGAGAPALVFSAIGIAANVAGLYHSDTVTNLYSSLVGPLIAKYFASEAPTPYPEHWVAPDLTLAPLNEIGTTYGNQVAVLQWDPDTHAVILGSGELTLQGLTGIILGSSGYVETGHVGSVPIIFPVPESPGWSIDIGPIDVIQPGGGHMGVDRYH